jgi:thiamine-monophosphate kinase
MTSELAEHQLLKKINELCPNRSKHLLTSIGDDAAVFKAPTDSSKNMVACQDMLIENIHFRRQTHSPEDLGYKSLAVNFSDIAAMGAQPLLVMVSLALPKNLKLDSWIEDFYRGANLICEKFGATIMGGDLSCSPDFIFIDVSVIGVCHQNPILRSGAKAGDLIGISGPLGLSAAGLKILDSLIPAANHELPMSTSTDLLDEFPISVEQHRRPFPRVDEAKRLGPFIHSLIDISDGLVNDLALILEQSSKRIGAPLFAQLKWDEQSFFHPELIKFTQLQKTKFNPIDFILYGGEDFELLFTFSPKNLESLKMALRNTPWMPIGKIELASSTETKLIRIESDQYAFEVDLKKRWQHF